MKNIITIQHTQSIHHTNGMLGSWNDWDLTGYGKEQANKIGIHLHKEIKDKQYAMYSSDLKRAKQTADIIAQKLNIVPQYFEELREQNLGKSAIGQSVEWFRQHIIKKDDTISALDYKLLVGAESDRDVLSRLTSFLGKIEPYENIIIVSHGGTLGMLYYLWMFETLEHYTSRRFGFSAGGVSFLKLQDDGIKSITKLNDMSYIVESD